jgi:hypothetical protein
MSNGVISIEEVIAYMLDTNQFGEVPARPAAGGVVQTGHDFSQPDPTASGLRVDVLDRDPFQEGGCMK